LVGLPASALLSQASELFSTAIDTALVATTTKRIACFIERNFLVDLEGARSQLHMLVANPDNAIGCAARPHAHAAGDAQRWNE
jgi:hypothetical protein